MSTVPDSDELKAKYAEIAALKKAIDEKKQEKNMSGPSAPGYNGYHYGNFNANRGGYRGGFRGGFKGRNNVHPYARGYSNNLSRGNMHRNMTVVFNGSNTNDRKIEDSKDDESNDKEPKYVSSVSKSGMSLVNSDVYEKDKIKIIQRSENAKQLQDQIKQKKKTHAIKNRVFKNQNKTDSYDRVKVNGDRFAVTNNGDDLILLSIPTGEKPKTVIWNHNSYARQLNGDLKSQTPRRGRVPSDQCRYFTRTGLCQKGSSCKYKHDQNHIKLCRQYLSNNCHNKNCLLSHSPSQYNTPLCRYFLENKCVNPKCTYEHVLPKNYDKPNYEIWVCRPFAIGGSCSRGRKCPFMHLFVCPDFQECGTCPRGKLCTLAHSATLSTQRLMLSKDSLRADTEVLIESDAEENDPAPQIINSYTIDPSKLFETSRDGKYDIYIDNEGSESNDSVKNEVNKNTFKENSEFMIHLDSDSEQEKENNSGQESYESELDDLQENNDYIEF